MYVRPLVTIKLGVMEAFPTSAESAGRCCWTEADDRQLRIAVESLGRGRWQHVSLILSGHSPVECHRRWRALTHHKPQERTWTDTEDQMLRAWTGVKGATDWAGCAALLEGRSARQCRRRWITHLAAERSEWSQAEDDRVLAEFEQFGGNWKLIAMRMGSRSEEQIRNRFYNYLQSRLPNRPISPASSPSPAKPEAETMTKEEAAAQVSQLLKHMRGLEALLVDAKFQAKMLEESMKDDEEKQDNE